MRNRGCGAQHHGDAAAAGRLVALESHGDIGDRPVERQLVGFARVCGGGSGGERRRQHGARYFTRSEVIFPLHVDFRRDEKFVERRPTGLARGVDELNARVQSHQRRRQSRGVDDGANPISEDGVVLVLAANGVAAAAAATQAALRVGAEVPAARALKDIAAQRRCGQSAGRGCASR